MMVEAYEQCGKAIIRREIAYGRLQRLERGLCSIRSALSRLRIPRLIVLQVGQYPDVHRHWVLPSVSLRHHAVTFASFLPHPNHHLSLSLSRRLLTFFSFPLAYRQDYFHI